MVKFHAYTPPAKPLLIVVHTVRWLRPHDRQVLGMFRDETQTSRIENTKHHKPKGNTHHKQLGISQSSSMITNWEPWNSARCFTRLTFKRICWVPIPTVFFFGILQISCFWSACFQDLPEKSFLLLGSGDSLVYIICWWRLRNLLNGVDYPALRNLSQSEKIELNLSFHSISGESQSILPCFHGYSTNPP